MGMAPQELCRPMREKLNSVGHDSKEGAFSSLPEHCLGHSVEEQNLKGVCLRNVDFYCDMAVKKIFIEPSKILCF